MRVRRLVLHGSPRVAHPTPVHPALPLGPGCTARPRASSPRSPASCRAVAGELYLLQWREIWKEPEYFFSSFISREAEPKVPALLEVSITSDKCVSHSTTVPFSSGSLPEFMLTQV